MPARNRVRLGLEAFESRLTPAVQASFNIATGILTVAGDDFGNDIRLSHTAARGFPAVKIDNPRSDTPIKTVLILGTLNRIIVDGHGGNDLIDARAIHVPVQLYGRDGRDVLMGGSKSDLLVGGIGDDDLYGFAGDDTLRGEGGRDGLFGGRGFDTLTGGNEPDRFLAHDASPDVTTDRGPSDATVEFRTHGLPIHTVNAIWSNPAWTDDDIRRVDRGLGDLHRFTETTTILELPSGANQAIYRLGVPFGPWAGLLGGTLGWNLGGSITLTDAAFADTGSDSLNELMPAFTVVHEVAHNWHHTSDYLDFQGISSWSPVWWLGLSLSIPSMWWFDASAGFARPYGTESPLEDWATTWEALFYADEINPLLEPTNRLRVVTAKVEAVEDFLAGF